jgi:hypothetical protein
MSAALGRRPVAAGPEVNTGRQVTLLSPLASHRRTRRMRNNPSATSARAGKLAVIHTP